MKYRDLGKSGYKVSEIGLGCEHLEGKEYRIVKSTIDAALDAGINILDCFMSEPEVRSNIGRALAGQRSKVFIQGHFRSVWKNGQYGRTLDIGEVKYFFEDLLSRLGTDYIDIGMVHLVDKKEDFDKIFNGEILEYVIEQKKKGRINLIGLSSHNAAIALQAVKTGLIDVLLFSINPAYDMLTSEHERPKSLSNDFFDSIGVNGLDPLRPELYKTCESRGVGITSMKTLAAGALLNEKTSPFRRPMTVTQCIHYALTRPAVSSALIGMQSPEEVEDALKYESAPEADRDFSMILTSVPKGSMEGKCVYCNHCLPCASHINIAAVNKYLDLTEMNGSVPPTVNEHYLSLENTASSCVECGICESNCPFNVPVMERMKRAVEVFGT